MSTNSAYHGGYPAQTAPVYHQPNNYQHAPCDPTASFAQLSLSSHTGYYPHPQPQTASPPNSKPLPDVQAIPAPQPKVAYNPPAFRTFQDRKRAKELALRAQSGSPSPATPPVQYSTPSPCQDFAPHSCMPTTFSPSSSQAPLPLMYSSRPGPQIAQPPSTTTVSNRPYVYPGDQPPPSPHRPTINAPQSPRSPLPLPGSARPLPQPSRAPATPTTPATPPGNPAVPAASAAVSPGIFKENDPNLERSDTISSVRSLDRSEFPGSRRPLPKAPVGVNSSRSLDRGIPSSSPSPGRRGWRRPPSVVEEDGESNVSASPIAQATPSIASPGPPPAIVVGNSPPSVPAIVEPAPTRPSISVAPPPPAIVVPVITIGDSTPATPRRSMPRPPSIVVPHITVGDSAKSPTPPVPKIVVPDILVGASPVAPPPAIVVPDITIGDSAPDPIPTINFPDDGPGEDTGSSEGIAFTGVPVISVSSEESHSAHGNVVSSLPSGAIICAGCQEAIIGRIVNAMDKRFHPQCFRCNECSELLEHVSSYEYEGKAYCHLDYHDKFAPRCHHCRTPIVESRFVTLSDPVLGQRYYHELHFFCSECGDPFLDPSKSSAPGARPSLQEEDGETNPFVIQKGHPYCERCHLRLHKPKCKKCTKPIPDIALSAMGSKWHQECFVCTQCGQGFANNLFFPQDGQALCTSCYESSLYM